MSTFKANIDLEAPSIEGIAAGRFKVLSEMRRAGGSRSLVMLLEPRNGRVWVSIAFYWGGRIDSLGDSLALAKGGLEELGELISDATRALALVASGHATGASESRTSQLDAEAQAAKEALVAEAAKTTSEADARARWLAAKAARAAR